MIKIPQNNKFSQTNTGELSGNVYQTKNISFDTEGVIKLEKRIRNIFDSDTYTDLVTSTAYPVHKFVKVGNSQKYWVMGDDSLYHIKFESVAPYGMTLTKDVTSGTPTSATNKFDGCMFKGADGTDYFCVVTAASALYYYNGTVWANKTVNAAPFIEFVCVFENKRSLAIAGQNKIVLIDDSFNVPSVASLTLPADYTITSMAWNNNRLYIGTIAQSLNEAFIFEWDGSSAEANPGYKINAHMISSLIRYKDGCVCVTSSGELLYVNGGTKRLEQFPIFTDEKQWIDETNIGLMFAPVLQGGMVVDGDNIYMGVDSSYVPEYNDGTSDVFENNFPSGVWCYDPKVGLYHKYSVDGASSIRTGAITTANINTTTNIITIPSSICPDTGTPVFYDDSATGTGTRATPLEINTRYFVIKLSGTTLKLATTYSNAIAGTAIDLTATGNNAQTLIFADNRGFGGAYEKARGVNTLRKSAYYRGMPDSFAGRLLVGGNVYKNNNTVYVAIGSVADKQENRGYEITPRIQSHNIKDVWQKVYLKFNPLVNEDDKIIIKYRTTKPKRLLRKIYSNSVGGTWVNSTSFTTTEPRFSEVQVGDELEIVRGAGAGYLAHITNIVLATGTYTVTIDETVQNIATSDTFSFTVDNWIKLKEITATGEGLDGVSEIPVMKQSKWIQFKIELRGIDIVVEEFQLIQETFKPSA